MRIIIKKVTAKQEFFENNCTPVRIEMVKIG